MGPAALRESTAIPAVAPVVGTGPSPAHSASVVVVSAMNLGLRRAAQEPERAAEGDTPVLA